MSTKKIIAVVFIYFIAFLAWMFLGINTESRTNRSYSNIKSEVAGLYGDTVIIKTPLCYTKELLSKKEYIDDKEIIKQYFENHYHEISKTDIDINIHLDPRKKGNLWFPTFQSEISSEYVFKIKDYKPGSKYYIFSTLESVDSIYRDIQLTINDIKYDDLIPLIKKQEIEIIPDSEGIVKLEIAYKSSGMDRLLYYISDNENIEQLNNFRMNISTDFKNIDFPNYMMSPQKKTETDSGFELLWELDNAITGKDIGIIIPNKLNPGEIISRVIFFAPVPLFFFFTVLLVLSVVLKINFHPVHFAFISAAFFSFHLMFSYFSDHMNIYLSFAISSIVSIILTVSYLRLFTPKIMAYIFAPLTQMIYLVIFSYSFFFEGKTGIIVTICSVITLFILMQLTGKSNWDEIFNKEK